MSSTARTGVPPRPLPCDTWIDAERAQLIELASKLVGFDTSPVSPWGEQLENQEEECQAYLREWLEEAGIAARAVRPEPAAFEDPMTPPEHDWRGRSMTLAHMPGAGDGRSMILNGHVDVVSAGELSAWQRRPFSGDIADGRVHGRGSADMKGGLASACFALKALHATDTPLSGDVWLQVVTDEETSGMGTVAMLKAAPAADAAICPEPTGLHAWVACRGVMYGRVTVHGRAGHAEGHQQDWRRGGGVSAIEKLRHILDAIAELNADWQTRRDKQHPLLSRPRIVPTVVRGGEFVASFPSICSLDIDVTYLPADADAAGSGSAVRHEVETEINYRLAADPWLRVHPAVWEWYADYPAYEAPDVEALCAALDDALAPEGRSVRRRGLDSWHDAASLGRRLGIPAVSFGPGDPRLAHMPDESIEVAELILGAKALARTLLGWCGSPGVELETSSEITAKGVTTCPSADSPS